jgi:antitoxin ParD1/3/4
MEVKMHVSLTDQLEKMVKPKVARGMYNNASEIVRESLRFMEAHEAWAYQMNKRATIFRES